MGRLLRLILFVLALPVFFLLGLWTLAWSSRRHEEEDAEREDTVEALVAGDPEDEDDDAIRRALIDMTPDERVEAVNAFFQKQAIRVVPVQPLDEWYRERRIRN